MAWLFLKVYNVFSGLFYTIALGLLVYQLLDLPITAFVFLWTGEFSSVLQKALDLGITEATFLSEDSWQLHTGLKGFDWLINSFISLQYSVSGRWMMVGISGVISILMAFFRPCGGEGVIKDSETGSVWTDAGGLGSYLSIWTVIAPIFWGVSVGLMLWLMDLIVWFF